jgi:hypothetical protein
MNFRYLFFFFILFVSCSKIMMVDVYKENLPNEVAGKVRKKELYKGGGVLLYINTDEGERNIGLDGKFFKDIRKGDYFVKKKNSNKCTIIRNDSIIHLDCYDIPDEIRDSLRVIEEWLPEEKGYWKAR